MTKQQVNGKQLKDILRFVIENVEVRKLPLCIWGVHGIGKTEIVGQVSKEMNYNLVPLHLSTQDITDLIGIPYQKDGVQFWSTPKWLQDAKDRYLETGIPNLFFLDEMNRGHPIVLKAMLPFLLDGTLHLHSIGPKDCVVSACNPATDDYEVNDMTDKALTDRLGHVIFKPTDEEYIAYCKSKEIDDITLQVIKKNPNFINIPKQDLTFDIKPSRRAIFNVMSVIGKKDAKWIRNRAKHIIECYLGTEFRDRWLDEYVKTDIDVDIDVLKDINKNKDFIMERITKTIDGLTTCAIDVVEKLTTNIKSYIEDKNKSLTKDDIEWITEFYCMTIIPEEFVRSVFFENSHITYMTIVDKVINRLVGELLDKRNITTETVKSW